MRLLCPNCREPLTKGEEVGGMGGDMPLCCSNGHVFYCQDGVLPLLADGFAAELQQFTHRLSQMRGAEHKRLLTADLYPQLPFIEPTGEGWEWRMRRYDLQVLASRLPTLTRQKKGLQVLDVGAWNGWLSYRLSLWGHGVTAVDYFHDEYDGLAAKKFYPVSWQAVQMDLTDLSLLDTCFDLVILNRCLQFAPDPVQMITQARARLAAGGLLLVTGLQIFADARQKAEQVTSYRQQNWQKYGFELFLKPTKGYLDGQDKKTLQTLGVQLRPYSQLWLANLKSYLKPTLPRHFYGLLPGS